MSNFDEKRDALIDWLKKMEMTHFLTLNVNGPSNFRAGQRLLRKYFQRVDRALLGPKYWRYDERRLMAVAFPEHVTSNFHYHCATKFNCRDELTELELRSLMDKKWKKVVKAGSTNLQVIHDEEGLFSYVTKEIWKPGRYRDFVISSQFWR